MPAKEPTHLPNSFRLRYGFDGEWSLASDEQHANVAEPVAAAEDLPATIAAALESPRGLPSLDQVIVPGDTVALAIDPSLPALAEVVGRVARWLCEKGTEPSNLKIVLASHDPQMVREVEQGLESCFASGPFDAKQVAIEGHDPDDPQRCAYVAANEDSEPIYMNRTLVDADVVIPLVCTRHADTLDYLGPYSIFPLLSNRSTLGEFYSLSRLNDPVARGKLKLWADQAAWWLGLLAAVQVVPAEGNRVAAVLSGLNEELEVASQEAFTKLWRSDCGQSEIVIALLDGSQSQQNWREVARGLRNATRFASLGGAIVICTQLRESVGKGLRRLSDVHHSREAIAKKLSHDSSDDALPAAVVLEATADYHVYLTSELPRGVVEQMGLGVIESETQLAHLVAQHGSCTILGSAQHRFWSNN
jgi:nickel-dependent lactate racemase